MGRPSNTARRREELVGGLLRVMAARGYGGATIGEIAREANLPPGVVHYHFDSKKAILVEVLGRLSRGVRERYLRKAARAGRTEPRGRVHAWIDAHVALGPDDDARAMACWVAIGAEALRDRSVREVYERVLIEERGTLESIVRAALAAEGRATRTARGIAVALLAAVQGAFQLGCTAPGTIARGTMAPLLRRLADGLIAAEPRAR
ncbi:MAG: TetR family transcriptional regulator C-terminal domain-containing protein [Planctomycetes bacterium]|nr:TetR family transcriptional regulator C-terminal domain-containing protein [Planctomycetota bacterium]